MTRKAAARKTDAEALRDYQTRQERKIKRLRRRLRLMESEITDLAQVERVAAERLIDNTNASGRPLNKRGRTVLVARLCGAQSRLGSVLWHQHALMDQMKVAQGNRRQAAMGGRR